MKLKDFLEEYPNITLVGFAWALFWRLVVVMYIIIFLFKFFIINGIKSQY